MLTRYHTGTTLVDCTDEDDTSLSFFPFLHKTCTWNITHKYYMFLTFNHGYTMYSPYSVKTDRGVWSITIIRHPPHSQLNKLDLILNIVALQFIKSKYHNICMVLDQPFRYVSHTSTSTTIFTVLKSIVKLYTCVCTNRSTWAIQGSKGACNFNIPLSTIQILTYTCSWSLFLLELNTDQLSKLTTEKCTLPSEGLCKLFIAKLVYSAGLHTENVTGGANRKFPKCVGGKGVTICHRHNASWGTGCMLPSRFKILLGVKYFL